MKTLVSCAYNMDNCCVELKFTDGSMIAIDIIFQAFLHVLLLNRIKTGRISKCPRSIVKVKTIIEKLL